MDQPAITIHPVTFPAHDMENGPCACGAWHNPALPLKEATTTPETRVIRVVHVSQYDPGNPTHVWVGYAGRYNGGAMTNAPLSPVWMGQPKDEYTGWLLKWMLTDDARRAEMLRLYRIWTTHGTLSLACWCAPKACHADVIRDTLLRMQ